MRIVTSQEMSALEAQAYHAGYREADFMEKAGAGVAFIVSDYLERHGLDPRVLLLCGKGNNAGDAYVAGTHLLGMEYEVTAIQVVPIEQTSALCQEHYKVFIEEGGHLWDGSYPVERLFLGVGIIVDGLFGTGFRGTVQEPFASIIELANRSQRPIIAIDIPSGLSGESGAVEGEVIIAAETAFLGLPKLGFFLREGWDCVGKLRYVDFGFPQQYVDEAAAPTTMLTAEFLKPLLPKLRRSRHKYQAGYVVALAGSPLFPGAGLLAATAALRGGAGIVKLLYPEGMRGSLAMAPPELIMAPYSVDDADMVVQELNRASSVLIGPGLGRDKAVKELLERILPLVEVPAVLDADVLNFLSESSLELPRNAILTPHRGELARLLKLGHIEEVDESLLAECKAFVSQRKTTLLLKGGPTFIFHPDKPVAVNPAGDPGMATAGSGDVLTGLLAALLAQGMPPPHAAMMGAFLHGVAGEHAAYDYTSYCMTASDIISYFPEAMLFSLV